MKKFYSGLLLLGIITSCTKLDTTTIGQGLIPAVDNVNTFATDTFTISVDNGIFNDTSRLLKSDDHILGYTQNNTQFGNTDARIYAQFNPSFGFKWKGIKRDSIITVNQGTTQNGYDSAFLCLGLYTSATDNGIWGDTSQTITFDLYRVNTTATFKADSNYRLATDPNITDDNVIIGTVNVKPSDLRKYNRYKLKQTWDSVNNQIRIPLNNIGKAWVQSNWLGQDDTTAGFNAMKDLIKFTALNKGFYVKARNTGNTLFKVALANNQASRFEVWYKYKDAGKIDTANQFFYFNSNPSDPWVSANANHIIRNTSGSAMDLATTPAPDNFMYIESTPGSFANIKIPHLKGFPKKMVHRAELIVQEDPAFRSAQFYAPTRLLLDCIDTANVSPKKFRSVPFDYYIVTSQVDFDYFGGDRKSRTDAITGNPHSTYTFNVTKYVQNVCTGSLPNFDFRLYAPFDTRNYSQSLGYYSNFGSSFNNTIWPLINPTAFGRVVLGGGTGNYKVKLKIIYSNI